MVLSTRALALAASLASLLFSITVTASPLEHEKRIDVANFGLNPHKRQDPGPGGGAVDPSGIEPEDEDPAQIAADGTGPLRSAVPARKLYTNQPSATWYQVSTGANDASASFTAFGSTSPEVTPIPPPSDKNQIRGPNPWNVDHIFELQVIGEAFKSPKPSNIPATDWSSATSAIFTAGPQNAAIANAVTNLNNLQGIPNALNGFKKQVFTGNLTGSGFPGSGNDAKYYNFFGPAIKKYLSDNQASLMDGTVDETGNQIQSAANGNADVKSYFTSYASFHYQGCIDYLSSSWQGMPAPSATTSAATSAATSTGAAPAASVTCYHMADPDNTCAAIADGPGWCECGTDPATYAIMPSPATQPCAWTTTPPTTSINCPASTPTAEAPPPPAYATGTCAFHLTETQTCDDDSKNLFAIVKLVDANKADIGDTPVSTNPLGAPINAGDSYSFDSKLPNPIVITGEHRHNYIQFTYGGLSWKSTDKGGQATCNVGGWDPSDGPVCDDLFGDDQNAVKNMDCFFPC